MIKKILLGAVAVFSTLLCTGQAMAIDGFLVSPTNQNVILTPGETTTLTVKVSNPSGAAKNINYEASVSPFSVAKDSSDYTVDLYSKSNYTQITDWIKIENPTGVVAPNSSETITFTINVPRNAPAGGQYASINVSNVPESEQKDNVGITEIMEISSLLYATVTGEADISGEIYDLNTPGFLLSPPFSASSMVKNNGNVHQTAQYILQVFPLFSNEEIYTNEENPSEAIVIPEQTYFHTANWSDGAPTFGIFKVKQTVKFAGEEATNERMVIICPIWLLFIIIFAIILIIFWLVAKSRNRKK